MAGKYGSASVLWLVDGYDFLAAKVKGLSLKIGQITEEASGLGDAYEANYSVGKTVVTITQTGGLFDTATGSVHTVMAAGTPTTPQATARTAIFGPMGNTLGVVAYGIQGAFTTAYEIVLQLSKLTKANVEYQSAGLAERGMIIAASAAATADANGASVDYTADLSQYVFPITSATKANPCVVTTTNPHGLATGQKILTSGNTLSGPSINSDQAITVISTTTFSVAVDTSASTGAGTGGTFVLSNSLNGAAGYQQVTAFSGLTGFIGKLQHSTDNASWSDISGLTFTNVTSAPGKERLTATGTIHRYVRYVDDVTGTGSVTRAAMLARL